LVGLLAEPVYVHRADVHSGFAVLFSKDPFSPDRLRSMGLDDQQLHIVALVKEHACITNKQVQALLGVSKATATRYLSELEIKRIIVPSTNAAAGRSTH
jgi:ATP-dependent DNA helicase RecG